MNMRMATLYLKAHHALPDMWSVYRFTVLDDGSVELQGGVSVEDEFGKRVWDKGATNQKFVLHPKEVHDWLLTEGICPECENTGRVCTGWSRVAGASYKPCGCGRAAKESDA